MYATPVVEGKTVVPVASPPGSMTQRARLGRSPRPSSSRRTSQRAPSMSTRTALREPYAINENLGQESGPGIHRGRWFLATQSLLDLDRDLHAERQVRRAVALVRSFRRAGERHFVCLVRLRQERSGQVVDGVL